MRTTAQVRDIGQSLWLDNITRDLLVDGTLKFYIDQLSVTGVTSNPSIFHRAIMHSGAYDSAISEGSRQKRSGEDLFLDIAIDDIQRAADLLNDTHTATNGLDGWVSLEVPPSLAQDQEGTIAAATYLSRRADRPNVFIKIPGTAVGLAAIEESIFNGIPVNITLLFSPQQYLAAADAYLKGIERRITAGKHPVVPSVASVFISRWDTAVQPLVEPALRHQLGLSVAKLVYRGYQDLLKSPRWLRALNFGAQPQRLLWASTGTKDPDASATFYVDALVAPYTINTLPDATLKALAEHTDPPHLMSGDERSAEPTLSLFQNVGIDIDTFGDELQKAGVTAFAAAWKDLMTILDEKQKHLDQEAS